MHFTSIRLEHVLAAKHAITPTQQHALATLLLKKHNSSATASDAHTVHDANQATSTTMETTAVRISVHVTSIFSM
jgi:hypothetical protein